ncbi:MAG: hypothetical protein KDB10_20400 [Acidimicrobiales bacterium]|nr:hypothetical protein [Acidimicrobiales bacterium]
MPEPPADPGTQPGPSSTGPGSLADDEAAFRRYGAALADAVATALPGWVARCVSTVLADQGIAETGAVTAEARAAGARARDDVVPRLRDLLAGDVDAQPVGPLSLLREAVRYPTEVLLAAGASPVERDEFDARAFPDDHFALGPAAFADVDEALAEPGLRWGAAKAYVHLARRRGPRA